MTIKGFACLKNELKPLTNCTVKRAFTFPPGFKLFRQVTLKYIFHFGHSLSFVNQEESIKLFMKKLFVSGKKFFALNYRFSAPKNTNLWFKLELGISTFFSLAMSAAVSVPKWRLRVRPTDSSGRVWIQVEGWGPNPPSHLTCKRGQRHQ